MPARRSLPPVQSSPTTSTPVIDLERDDLRPVNELVKARFGKRISPATLWRWRLRGIAGVRLHCVYLAGCWCTTATALAEFIRTSSAAKAGVSAVVPSLQAKHSESTVSRLKAAGLLE